MRPAGLEEQSKESRKKFIVALTTSPVSSPPVSFPVGNRQYAPLRRAAGMEEWTHTVEGFLRFYDQTARDYNLAGKVPSLNELRKGLKAEDPAAVRTEIERIQQKIAAAGLDFIPLTLLQDSLGKALEYLPDSPQSKRFSARKALLAVDAYEKTAADLTFVSAGLPSLAGVRIALTSQKPDLEAARQGILEAQQKLRAVLYTPPAGTPGNLAEIYQSGFENHRAALNGFLEHVLQSLTAGMEEDEAATPSEHLEIRWIGPWAEWAAQLLYLNGPSGVQSIVLSDLLTSDGNASEVLKELRSHPGHRRWPLRVYVRKGLDPHKQPGYGESLTDGPQRELSSDLEVVMSPGPEPALKIFAPTGKWYLQSFLDSIRRELEQRTVYKNDPWEWPSTDTKTLKNLGETLGQVLGQDEASSPFFQRILPTDPPGLVLGEIVLPNAVMAELTIQRLAGKWGIANLSEVRIAAVTPEVVAKNSTLQLLIGRPVSIGDATLLIVPKQEDRMRDLLISLMSETRAVSIQGYGQPEDAALDAFEKAAQDLGFPVQKRIPLQSQVFRDLLRQIIANLLGLQAEVIEEQDLIDLENALSNLA